MAVKANFGFTLVEVLVALAISVLLMSGVISVLLSSKQAYLRREVINHMQENLRVATYSLKKAIGRSESIEQGSNQAGIVISYNPHQEDLNCLGQPVTAGHIIGYFYVDKGALYCSVSYPPTAISQQPLVEGIAAIQFQYGVDTNDDGQVDGYGHLPADRHKIISIRVLLRLLDTASNPLPEVTLTIAMRPRIFSRLGRTIEDF